MRNSWLDRVLGAIEGWFVAVLATTALIIGAMQVILRYVFNTGFPWSEGIFITLTVWAMLLAGSRAVRDRIHIKVDVFVLMLPPRIRRPIQVLANVISLGLCLFFAYCGFLYVRFVWQVDVISVEAGIREWIIYSIIPLSMALFSIRYIQILWRMIVHGEEDASGHAETGGAET